MYSLYTAKRKNSVENITFYLLKSVQNIKKTLVFMFFTLIFDDNFLLLILANCVHDDSCREKLAPISPNGSKIQDAAVNPAHICTLWDF